MNKLSFLALDSETTMLCQSLFCKLNQLTNELQQPVLKYSKYIILNILGPLVTITFVLAGIVWLMQALRFIDLIVNRRLDTMMFLYLASLLLPFLLVIVIPAAMFISITYAFNRMQQESELVVLSGAGVSRWQMMRPALTTGLGLVLLGYFLTLYLMPVSYHEFKNLQNVIRDNYASVLLQEEVFNTPIQGITIFIRSREDATLKCLLVQDERDPDNPITMLAREGQLVQTSQGPRFILLDGTRQEIDRKTNRITILHFDRYAVDITSFAEKKIERWKEPEERFLGELLYPEDGEPQQYGKLWAEAHHRLLWPLMTIVLTLLALTPYMIGEFNRRGQWRRSAYAIVTAIIIITLYLGTIKRSADAPNLVILSYILVIGSLIGLLKLNLSQTTPRFLQRIDIILSELPERIKRYRHKHLHRKRLEN